MGDLFSLFWEVEPSSVPLNFPISDEDYECREDDSCGTIGSFLLWYFVIILALICFSRTSVWMSEDKKDEDSGTSSSGSKASKETSCKREKKDGDGDSSQAMEKPKLQSQLTLVTDSEAALVRAYVEQRQARHPSQFHEMTQNPHDSDTTECDSEESNSEVSSWKESESENHPSSDSTQRRTTQRHLGGYQLRERPCLHCKALRTHEWLTHHFPKEASATAPAKGEENSKPESHAKPSQF
ncbi:serine-rich single-pass membrane protein 1 [Carlito syrichta]|uniref:Serine-rich single-pass membrane protein 1 n=1 Tax=Carlito syrichta TaxID=1868482 RepID=A0A1U7T1Q3_CARSF|nr:serine-rich single-pass membrane protein 1 [Carlito syrichta]